MWGHPWGINLPLGVSLLTDRACRSAKRQDRSYKLADGGGLYLFVTTTGFRSWRLKYRFAGREKTLTFGEYPEVSLAEARDARTEAKRLIRVGVDPSVDRKVRAAELVIKSANTFEAIARVWHAKQHQWDARYKAQILSRLTRDTFSTIGMMPIRSITPALVLELIRKIEARGSIEMAHRVRQHISAVFVFAIASGLADQDPANVIQSALTPKSKRLQPARTKLREVRFVLLKTEAQSRHPAVKLASRLLALTAVRPGVLREAAPGEFEALESKDAIWRIPAAKMKLDREARQNDAFDFVVPLSVQAVEVVKVAVELAGNGPLLFPGVQSPKKPMSDGTLSKFYRDAGLAGRHVPHGWRSSFSTIMNELAAVEGRDGDRRIIDMMLAHMQAGVEVTYNRAAYMPRRREIAQRWADLLMKDMPPAHSLLE